MSWICWSVDQHWVSDPIDLGCVGKKELEWEVSGLRVLSRRVVERGQLIRRESKA